MVVSIGLGRSERGRIRTLLELLISRLAIVSTGWKTRSSAIPAEPVVHRLGKLLRRDSGYLCRYLIPAVAQSPTLAYILFLPSPGQEPLPEETCFRVRGCRLIFSAGTVNSRGETEMQADAQQVEGAYEIARLIDFTVIERDLE